MLIGIFSDSHCGYKYGDEQWKDSFVALNEAINKSLDCDLILIAGDMFDARIPKQEVFAKVAKILSKTQNIPTRTQFLEIINKDKDEVSPLALRGIPVVALHGNHERRSKYMINPIQALEHAGLLIHLNRSTIVFQIDGQKVAIHGMSSVPERFAKDVLREWNPKPIPEAVNILMIHQSVTPYVYSPLEPPSLELEELPKGFDLYIMGHLHWYDKKILHNAQLLVTGSTIPTSMNRSEAEQTKAIHKFDGSIKHIPLENQRKIFWGEFRIDPSIKEKVETFISTISPTKPKPIINITIKGTLKEGYQPPRFTDLEEKYKHKAIINIKKKFDREGFEEQVEKLRMFREQKLSPEEYGIKILQEKMKEVKFNININDIFGPLVEGNTDLIFNILIGEQKTLVEVKT